MSHKLLRAISGAFLCFSCWAQAPAPPSDLAATSATSRQVKLSWTASDGAKSYSLQRKSDGNFADVLTVSSASAFDPSIDPYTTYTYRVVAVNDSGSSGASNEVTVGPPPYGFSVAAPGPATEAASLFGSAVRMTLDANGDPALAYIIEDPNLDQDFSDSTVNFVSWSRALYQWSAPVMVAKVGDTVGSGLIPISIAWDASTNTFGIAYEVESGAGSRIDLATSSDGGGSWMIQTVASDAGNVTLQEPSLGMARGQAHLAFYHDYDGIRYVNGLLADNPKTWNSQLVPPPGGFNTTGQLVSLAIDSDGAAGMAFMAFNDATSAEAFWRPAAGNSSVIVADNNGHQNDFPDVALSFAGAQPRVAYTGGRDDQYYSDYGHDLWIARSTDNGGTWLPMVNPPADGNRSMNAFLSIASGLQGQAAVVTESNSGSLDGVVCGTPKLTRSDDLLLWKTCGISPLSDPAFGADYPIVRFGGNDKLWISFRNSDFNAGIRAGVIVWREK